METCFVVVGRWVCRLKACNASFMCEVRSLLCLRKQAGGGDVFESRSSLSQTICKPGFRELPDDLDSVLRRRAEMKTNIR